MHKEEQDSKLKKKLVFYLLGFAVIICCICLSLYWLRSDWRMIVWGTLAFLVGSGLLVLAEERKEGALWKWLKAILVPLILAAGGLFTTAHFITSRNRVFNTKNGPSGRL